MEQQWSNLTNYIKAGYRSNAYAPIVWALGLIFMFIAIFYSVTADPLLKFMLVVLFIVSALFGLVMYVVLLLKDPRLLQSESFRLEDKKLDMITQKGSDFVIKPVDLVPPVVNQIREGENNG